MNISISNLKVKIQKKKRFLILIEKKFMLNDQQFRVVFKENNSSTNYWYRKFDKKSKEYNNLIQSLEKVIN